MQVELGSVSCLQLLPRARHERLREDASGIKVSDSAKEPLPSFGTSEADTFTCPFPVP